MSNKNCLEGLRCPRCKQASFLQIMGTSLFRVADDGTESHENVEWDDNSYARCPACHFAGKLKDFTIEPVLKNYEVVIYETKRFVGVLQAANTNDVERRLQTREDVHGFCEEDREYYKMDIATIDVV